MTTQLVLVVLGATVLLGMALVATMRAERRRETRQQRLQAVVTVPPAADEPSLPLRRPQARARLRGFLLLSMARERLDGALAATGDRIAVPHLALSGSAALVVVMLFSGHVMGFSAATTTVFGAAAGVSAPLLLLRFAQNRFSNRFLDIFPDALDLVGRAVKAGLPVIDAMEVAAREIRAPVGTAFKATLDEMRIGVDIEEALQHTADRIRVPDFRFYVVALALQRRTGGGLAEALANLSSIIRRRKELRLKTRALTSESKASAAVLGALPFVVAVILFFLNRELILVLFVDHRGRFMLGLAMLSVLMGVAVMAIMIRRALR